MCTKCYRAQQCDVSLSLPRTSAIKATASTKRTWYRRGTRNVISLPRLESCVERGGDVQKRSRIIAGIRCAELSSRDSNILMPAASLSSQPWIVAIPLYGTLSLFNPPEHIPDNIRAQTPTLGLQPFGSYFPIVSSIHVGVFKLLPKVAIYFQASPMVLRNKFASFSISFNSPPISIFLAINW